MPKSRPPDPLDSPEAVAAAIGQIRDDLGRFEQSLATSIQTKEVVVTSEDGNPRVIISATGRGGRMEIVARSDLDVVSAVEVFATDRSDRELEHAGVALVRQGDIVGIFEVLGVEPPELWLDDSLEP